MSQYDPELDPTRQPNTPRNEPMYSETIVVRKDSNTGWWIAALLAAAVLVAVLWILASRGTTDSADVEAQARLAEAQAAQAQVNALVTREATLLGQIDEEQFAAIAGPLPRVAVPAYVEHDAVSPNRLLVTAGGALAGLVVALIVVAVLGRRMTRH